MAAHQTPLSLGFSRQEYWSGLPFPSPTHESEKWKLKVKSLRRVRLCVTPWTVAYQADFPGKNTGVGCHCLLWKREHILLFCCNDYWALKFHHLNSDLSLKLLITIDHSKLEQFERAIRLWFWTKKTTFGIYYNHPKCVPSTINFMTFSKKAHGCMVLQCSKLLFMDYYSPYILSNIL